MRLAYTAEYFSLAIIEYFVHIDSDDAPADLVVVRADVPENVSRLSLSLAKLPGNWRATPPPPELARMGDDFVRNRRAAILIVPSVLVSTESN